MAPLIVAGLIMVIWGATPVATRLAVADLDPLHVGLLRTALAGVLALPIALALRLPLPKRRGDWALLLVSAATGFIIFPLIYSFGQRETSAMHGGMILAALPIFTGSYAAAVERRRPRARWLVGCAIALAGEVMLIALRAGSGGAAPTLLGDLLVLLSASPDLYVPRVGAVLNAARVICTQVRFEGDRLDGQLLTANRRGEEKRRVLEQLRGEFPQSRFAAYGNADSDLAHLACSDEPLLVNASAAARREAARLGIKTADWT